MISCLVRTRSSAHPTTRRGTSAEIHVRNGARSVSRMELGSRALESETRVWRKGMHLSTTLARARSANKGHVATNGFCPASERRSPVPGAPSSSSARVFQGLIRPDDRVFAQVSGLPGVAFATQAEDRRTWSTWRSLTTGAGPDRLIVVGMRRGGRRHRERWDRWAVDDLVRLAHHRAARSLGGRGALLADRMPHVVSEDDGDWWYVDGRKTMSFLGIQTGDRFDQAIADELRTSGDVRRGPPGCLRPCGIHRGERDRRRLGLGDLSRARASSCSRCRSPTSSRSR